MPVDEPARKRPTHSVADLSAGAGEDGVDEEVAADYSQRARDARKEQGLAPVLDDDEALDRVIDLLEPRGAEVPGEAAAE